MDDSFDTRVIGMKSHVAHTQRATSVGTLRGVAQGLLRGGGHGVGMGPQSSQQLPGEQTKF
jgi:hypothetical protein